MSRRIQVSDPEGKEKNHWEGDDGEMMERGDDGERRRIT